jgi:capsular exopolysaccharide synthesis family protein
VDPAEYLRALRHRWAVIVAAVAVAVLVGWFTSTVVPVAVPTVSYRAEVWVLDTGATVTAPGEISGLSTMASLVTIRPVAERVAERLGFEGDPMSLTARVAATTGEESGIMVIAATDAGPKEAERLAEAFTLELLGFLSDRKTEAIAREQEFLSKQLSKITKEIDSLDQRIELALGSEKDRLEAERNGRLFLYGSLQQQFQQLGAASAESDRLQIIQEATAQAVTTEGFQPPRSTASRVILAAVLGLMLGVGLALLLERLDTRIKTRQAAEKHFGFPVLSEIPPMAGNGGGAIVTSSQPTSPAADAFRLLAASLGDSDAGQPAGMAPGEAPEHNEAKVILVASAASQDGRSSVVANLAAAFAQVGKRALILSCDFRHPTLHQMFGLQNGVGLSEVLRKHWNGEPILAAHVRKTSLPGVALVPSGSLPPRPSTLLTTPTMLEVLREARRLADVVLLDTPPILLASDAAHLVGEVDLVLVVARAGKTTAEQAERARDLLKRLDAPVAGLALNEARELLLPSRRWARLAEWRTVALRLLHRTT